MEQTEKRVVLVAREIPAECVKRAQVLIVTDTTWHLLAPHPYRAHGLLGEGTMPTVQCTVVDLQGVATKNDEKMAEVIRMTTAPTAGVVDMNGLINGLCALGGVVVEKRSEIRDQRLEKSAISG